MINQSHNQQQGKLQYFDLIKRVGTKGRYQGFLLVLSLIIFFINSITTLNASFIFMNPQFDCASQGIYTDNCEKYVCENLDDSQIAVFPRIKKFQTIATQYGPFYCDDNYALGIYKSIQSIGAFIGILIGITISDNKSRKFAILISCSLVTIGLLCLALSFHLYMVCISLFIVGLGNNVRLRIIQAIITQQTEKKLAIIFLTISLIPFCLGQLSIGYFFQVTGEWRTFTLYFCFTSSAIQLLCQIFILQDSPKYLLRLSEQQAMSSLNKISFLNGCQYRFKEGDLVQYLQYQNKIQQIKSRTNFWDIFKYQSLRLQSICICYLFLCMDLFFYSHNAMVDKIGFNSVLNTFLMGLASLTTFPIAIFTVKCIPRRTAFIFMYTSQTLINLFLIFYNVPVPCQDCSQKVIQMCFIIICHATTYYAGILMFCMIFETYPVSIRNIGGGIPTLFGALGIFASQSVISSSFERSQQLPFIILSLLSFFGMICAYLLKQTLNQPLKDQIEQVSIKQKLVIKNQ